MLCYCFSCKENMDIKKHFSSIKDPRIERSKLHSLDTIFMLTIIASLCGVKSWEHISAFGKERQRELSEIIDFTNGVPSHDTLERVFSVINPKEFHACFVAWTQSLSKVFKKLIAIDGKVSKNSYDELKNIEPLYLVNAWASENKLVLGQVKTKGKGHEIAGVKELLNILEIEGAIISTDALSCQKDITQIITRKKGDYILAVKDNQELLKKSIVSSFAMLKPTSEDEQLEKNNGRIEIRKCTVLGNLKMIDNKNEEWSNLKSIIQVESDRTSTKSSQTEIRYYISSLILSAKEINKLIRSHWGIENSLHWVLDVNFGEDKSRKRKGFSSENYALINKIAINILNNDRETKLSMIMKKLKAMCNIGYVKKLLHFDA